MICELWLLLSCWLVCTGWVLSALHQLNAGGYVLSLLLFAALFTWWIRCRMSSLQRAASWGVARLHRRFRRPLPFIYLLLLVLTLLGDLLYAPTQYDALCYRLPRMLHWVSEGHWHWIHSGDNRLNLSSVNQEWMSMPLLVLTRSDRWLWIPNLISFALLPGLIFGMLRGLGITPRAAWSWMWLLPAGFCFVTQAGSIGNDLTAVPFALASIYFALRAQRGCYRDLVLSILSASMMTGIKASNLPLVLPTIVAALPVLHLLLRRAWLSLPVLIASLMVSFLPMALLNHVNAGHWTGDPKNASGMRISSLSEGLIGNGIMLTLGSIQPPVLPQRGLTKGLVTNLLGEKRMGDLKEAFPRFNPGLEELPVEEGSGLGLGVTIAILAAMILQFRVPRKTSQISLSSKIILIAGGVALAVYMMKMGSESAARLLTPYYPVVLAGLWLFLVRRQEVVRLASWRWIACLATLMAIPVLLLSPARPLWPAVATLDLMARHWPIPVIKRAAEVYQTYGNRNQALAPVRDALPTDAKKVGLAGEGGELETSLWWPFGSRQIIHVLPDDTSKLVAEKGVQVICTNSRVLKNLWKITPEEFAFRFKGIIIARPKATETVAWGEEEWIIVDLRPSR